MVSKTRSVSTVKYFAINIKSPITGTTKIAAIPNTIYKISDKTSDTNLNMIVLVYKEIARKYFQFQ